MGTLCRKVGNGASIRFWKDSWNGNGPLMSRFNRLYHLDANEECLLSDRSVNGLNGMEMERQVVDSRNEVHKVSEVDKNSPSTYKNSELTDLNPQVL
ncbi:hypothetical protein Tco_0818372 [Tanacetum coccineum]